MTRAIGIVRVSGPGQVDKHGPAVQQTEIERRAEELCLELVRVIPYQESASDALRRPQFELILHEVMELGKHGEISTVILAHPDRLGREGAIAFFHYLYLLETEAGLSVRFAHDDVASGDSSREIQLCLRATGAKDERVSIARRTTGARKDRAKKGRIPNGSVPWPFDYASKRKVGEASTGRPTINRGRTTWVRQWADWLIRERVTLGTVCKRMKEAGVRPPRDRSSQWSRSTITRILKNPALVGEFQAYEKDEEPKVIKLEGETVLTREQFDAIRGVLAQNREFSRRNKRRDRDYTPLRGLVRHECGKKAGGTPKGKYRYFRCNTCRDGDMNVDRLWAKVREELTGLLVTSGQLADVIQEQAQRAETREQLEGKLEFFRNEAPRIDRELDRALDAHLELPDYAAAALEKKARELEERRIVNEAQIELHESALRNWSKIDTEAQRLQAAGDEFKKRLDGATDREWRTFLQDLGAEVWYAGGEGGPADEFDVWVKLTCNVPRPLVEPSNERPKGTSDGVLFTLRRM